MCFVWISEQTAIIYLYSINRLLFITEKDCVYCAVRTESLNIIQVNLTLLLTEGQTSETYEPSEAALFGSRAAVDRE
jgi:hypothetical protein